MRLPLRVLHTFVVHRSRLHLHVAHFARGCVRAVVYAFCVYGLRVLCSRLLPFCGYSWFTVARFAVYRCAATHVCLYVHTRGYSLVGWFATRTHLLLHAFFVPHRLVIRGLPVHPCAVRLRTVLRLCVYVATFGSAFPDVHYTPCRLPAALPLFPHAVPLTPAVLRLRTAFALRLVAVTTPFATTQVQFCRLLPHYVTRLRTLRRLRFARITLLLPRYHLPLHTCLWLPLRLQFACVAARTFDFAAPYCVHLRLRTTVCAFFVPLHDTCLPHTPYRSACCWFGLLDSVVTFVLRFDYLHHYTHTAWFTHCHTARFYRIYGLLFSSAPATTPQDYGYTLYTLPRLPPRLHVLPADYGYAFGYHVCSLPTCGYRYTLHAFTLFCGLVTVRAAGLLCHTPHPAPPVAFAVGYARCLRSGLPRTDGYCGYTFAHHATLRCLATLRLRFSFAAFVAVAVYTFTGSRLPVRLPHAYHLPAVYRMPHGSWLPATATRTAAPHIRLPAFIYTTVCVCRCCTVYAHVRTATFSTLPTVHARAHLHTRTFLRVYPAYFTLHHTGCLLHTLQDYVRYTVTLHVLRFWLLLPVYRTTVLYVYTTPRCWRLYTVGLRCRALRLRTTARLRLHLTFARFLCCLVLLVRSHTFRTYHRTVYRLPLLRLRYHLLVRGYALRVLVCVHALRFWFCRATHRGLRFVTVHACCTVAHAHRLPSRSPRLYWFTVVYVLVYARYIARCLRRGFWLPPPRTVTHLTHTHRYATRVLRLHGLPFTRTVTVRVAFPVTRFCSCYCVPICVTHTYVYPPRRTWFTRLPFAARGSAVTAARTPRWTRSPATGYTVALPFVVLPAVTTLCCPDFAAVHTRLRVTGWFVVLHAAGYGYRFACGCYALPYTVVGCTFSATDRFPACHAYGSAVGCYYAVPTHVWFTLHTTTHHYVYTVHCRLPRGLLYAVTHHMVYAGSGSLPCSSCRALSAVTVYVTLRLPLPRITGYVYLYRFGSGSLRLRTVTVFCHTLHSPAVPLHTCGWLHTAVVAVPRGYIYYAVLMRFWLPLHVLRFSHVLVTRCYAVTTTVTRLPRWIAVYGSRVTRLDYIRFTRVRLRFSCTRVLRLRALRLHTATFTPLRLRLVTVGLPPALILVAAVVFWLVTAPVTPHARVYATFCLVARLLRFAVTALHTLVTFTRLPPVTVTVACSCITRLLPVYAILVAGWFPRLRYGYTRCCHTVTYATPHTTVYHTPFVPGSFVPFDCYALVDLDYTCTRFSLYVRCYTHVPFLPLYMPLPLPQFCRIRTFTHLVCAGSLPARGCVYRLFYRVPFVGLPYLCPVLHGYVRLYHVVGLHVTVGCYLFARYILFSVTRLRLRLRTVRAVYLAYRTFWFVWFILPLPGLHTTCVYAFSVLFTTF